MPSQVQMIGFDVFQWCTSHQIIENDEKNKTQSKEMLTTKKNDVNDSKNVNQKKLNNVKKSVDINDAELSKKFETKKDDGLLKKCVFHAAIDDVECYLEYPHCLVDMVTKNIRKLKDINNDIVINMTQILYKPCLLYTSNKVFYAMLILE